MKVRNARTALESAQQLDDRNRRLDCYEFCLMSLGEYNQSPGEREDPWDYVDEKEERGDVHGYQVV